MKHWKKLICMAIAVCALPVLLGGCSGSNLAQFDAPKTGEEVAIMTVKDYGTIKIRFFEEEAPKAVKNFITHAKNGYYDGVTFHRVMKDFMIQGGDPDGDGTGGESIYGSGFEVEVSEHLRHYRGALSMANTGQPNSNGSQFFIVQASTVTEDDLTMMEQYSGVTLTDEVKAAYLEKGGYPSLDGSYTVFGQVYEGMDVVDKIASCAVETDQNTGEPSKPVQPVTIEKIEIVKY